MSGYLLTPQQQHDLLSAAQLAQANAYAPYSHYHVGAAVLTRDGQIFSGCNVENASYPAGFCAERGAIAKAVSEGARDFVAVAVVTDSGGSPCGVCRQMLSEFNLAMQVLIYKTDGTLVEETTMAALLPLAFTPNKLTEK